MKIGIMSGIVVLAGLLALGRASAQPEPESESSTQGVTDDPIARQHEIRLLWAAGDYARAIEAGNQLTLLHPGHRRGQTAYFHTGNYLENQSMAEADSLAQMRSILESAQWYFNKAANEVSDPKDELRMRSLARGEGVTEKLKLLGRVERGEYDYVEAASVLAGLESSGVAVRYLEGQITVVPEREDHILFLMLTYQLQYVDQLNARVSEAYQMLRKEHPELFDYNYNKYMPLLDTAIEKGVQMGKKGVESFPESDHILDYHVHLGDAYTYKSNLYLARRDRNLEKGEATAAQHQLGPAIENLKLAKGENLAIIAHVNRLARSGEADESRQLARHKELAEERIAEWDFRLVGLSSGTPEQEL